jgi:hypothetical protein
MLLSSHEKLKDLAGKRGKPMTEILEEVLTKEFGETRQHGKRKDG